MTTGYLEFQSTETRLEDYDRVQGWTIAGSIQTAYTDTDLTGDIVNPFPTLLLDQIGFPDVSIQN